MVPALSICALTASSRARSLRRPLRRAGEFHPTRLSWQWAGLPTCGPRELKERDSKIFPGHYVPVMVVENGRRVGDANAVSVRTGWKAIETREVDVVLGTIEPGTRGPLDSEAICLPNDVCWPMTLPEGIQLSANPFHYEWNALTHWASKEDLSVEFRTGSLLAQV